MKKAFLLFGLILNVLVSNGQTYEWAKHIAPGTNHNDYAVSLCVDTLGNSYYTGVFQGTLDFDPDTAVANVVSSNGNSDAFVLKLDSLGNFVWVIKLGSTGADDGSAVELDVNGNVYVTGHFRDTVDFDPGVGVGNLYAPARTDMFLAKYDANGNFIYVKQIGGAGAVINIFDIELDGVSHIYLTGYFEGTVDFDPGVGVSSIGSLGGTYPGDAFILKLDSSGNFNWAKGLGSIDLDQGTSVSTDEYGNVYFKGLFRGTVDFDPGAGVHNISSAAVPSNWDCYILKLNSSGNFVWVRNWPLGFLSGFTYPNSLDVKSGFVYTTGNFENTTDFDPSGAFYNLTSVGNRDIYVSKLDTAGNFIWAKSMGGVSTDYGASISLDSRNRVYITGGFSGTADLDPGIAVFNQTSFSGDCMFALKMNELGEFIWAQSMSGASTSGGANISVDKNDDVFVCGGFWGTGEFEFDTTTYSLGYTFFQDIYSIKMSQDYCSSFALQIDSLVNKSCISNGFSSGFATGGEHPYLYSWNTMPAINDSVATFNIPGIYQLTVTDTNNCMRSASIIVDAPSTISSFDLNTNLINTTFRTGLTSNLWLDAFNDGCVPTSGTLQLILDTLVIYTTALPIPDMISGDTLTWNFSNLIYDSTHVMPQVIVQTPTWGAIGDTVCFNLIMNPIAGDADPTNNTKQYCFPVINSYDPNDKKVYPVGTCTPGYINDGELLTYTVRFQNTGNAPALDVYVLDSLDADLDLNTVRVIGNSHTLITEVLPGNVLKFRFDNINLADSTSNEAESHGYVVFEVMPNASLAIGTTIINNVGIYFDFNVPVYTNTVLNTISDGILNTGTTSMANVITADLTGASYQWLDCDNGNAIIPGATNQNYTATAGGNYSVIVSDGCFADTSVCVSVFVTGMSEDISGNQFSFFPNPSNNTITINTLQATQIKIVNMLGEVLIDSNVKDKSIVDISGLANGVYFIQTQEGLITKLIKQ